MHKWIVGGPKDRWRAEVTYSYKYNQRVYRIWYEKEIFAEFDADFLKAHPPSDFPPILQSFIETYKETYE